MRLQSFEQDFLEEAEGRVNRGPGFADQVEARLREGESMYGDRWIHMGLPRLLREILEEGLDLGAWAVLAAQHTDLLHRETESVARAHMLLIEVAAHGAAVDKLVEELREELL